MTGGGGGIVDARAGEECRAQWESMEALGQEGWDRRVGVGGGAHGEGWGGGIDRYMDR